MTYTVKYVPYSEALRIVAERVGLKKEEMNPLDIAIAEYAIFEVNESKAFPDWPLPSRPRFRMADIDRLWPPTATVAATDLPADDHDYPEQSAHLNISAHVRK